MKAEADPWKIIIGAIIVIFVVLVMIFIFRSNVGGQTKVFDEALCGINSDWNQDGIPDILQSCICRDPSECDQPGGPERCQQEKREYCEGLG